MQKLKKAQDHRKLNECKVNISFHHLDCEESADVLTCVILGSGVV